MIPIAIREPALPDGLVAIPVRTRLIVKGDDLAELMREALKGLARPGDVTIGTGKGSEDWIHVAGGKKIPWSERAVFEAALKKQPRSR